MGTVAATFTITSTNQADRPMLIEVDTADGSAVSPGDYAPASTRHNFGPGETSKAFTVLVNGDLTDESDETFKVNLTPVGTVAIADAQGIGTIVDDDDAKLSVNDVSVTEGDSGTTNAVFTVSTSNPSDRPISVTASAADDTAVAPGDYTGASGTLTLAPGETSKAFAVAVKGDVIDELDERFNVNLTAAVNAAIADAQGVGTIDDDDTATLSINNVTVTEGDSGTVNATFTVNSSVPSDRTITVVASTADDTATAPGDYVTKSQTLSLAPGQTSTTFTVVVNGDRVDELDEQFVVNLSSATNAQIGSGTGVGTIKILDDDTAELSVGDVTVTEGDSGTVDATFTISSSIPNDRTMTVVASTDADTALAPADFAAKSSTVSFAPGQTSRSFTVSVKGDLVDELDERFLVNLSAPTNAAIGDGRGIGTITDDDTAKVSIDDVSVTEGDDGTGIATFTVSLSTLSDRTVTIDAATADNTAVAPRDYLSADGTISFAPGQTSRTFQVGVAGDLVDELDERFRVNLSNPVNTVIDDGQGIGTILDDDTAKLSVDDVRVTEGDSGTVDATFTVSSSNPSDRIMTVVASTSDDTATAPADYAAKTATLTFSPDQTSKTFAVAVKGDLIDELDERFHVDLSAAVVAEVADGHGVGTITDDDTAKLSVDDVSVTEGDSGTVDATFSVSSSNPSDRALAVLASTAAEFSDAGVDYVSKSSTLSFAPGETSKSFTVQVKGDLVDELTERFFVNLSAPVNAEIADGQGIGTILDDDTARFSIDDVTVTEGDSGTVAATFTISSTNEADRPMLIEVATADGSAVAPGDYGSASTRHNFGPGETSKAFTVFVNGDTVDELDETFKVNLTPVGSVVISDAQGIGTITDDDDAKVSIGDVSVTEGDLGIVNATFEVSLSTSSDRTVSVNAATLDDSASQLSDYVAASSVVSFAPGQTSRTFTVSVNGDAIDELDERFFVDLSAPVNTVIADGRGVGTIRDDDEAVLSVDDVTVIERDSGSAAAVFTVSSSNPSDRTISVDAWTADDSAVAPADYQGAAGTVTLAPGQTSRTFSVAVNGDLIDELDERFNVNLTAAVNATIGDAQGIGTITDDDTATLSVSDDAVTEGDSGTTLAAFTVSSSNPSDRTISVDVATVDDTAREPADYTAKSAHLTFAPGQTSTIVHVAVNGDLVDELDERFGMTLSEASQRGHR